MRRHNNDCDDGMWFVLTIIFFVLVCAACKTSVHSSIYAGCYDELYKEHYPC